MLHIVLETALIPDLLAALRRPLYFCKSLLKPSPAEPHHFKPLSSPSPTKPADFPKGSNELTTTRLTPEP
ncbi:hypothetical protein CHARACLAT_024287 [Characodon lateralis]|uniref:Uncharacterized protein n=1 Tax=Characodon lateralis TaxID=208331 RepID=A0ABU7DCA1_9TELE|nr:hypothetical protein [Characodon lateralis]